MVLSSVEWVSRLHENEVSGEDFREEDFLGKSLSGRRNRKCKSPEVKSSLDQRRDNCWAIKQI